jgi:gluconate 5-dehydrogenase
METGLSTGAPTGVASLFSLEGKVAIVTGASRGIGHALASGLSLAGAATIGVARSAAPDTPLAGGTDYVVADVAMGIGGVVAAVMARFGRLDILVNAAGVSLPSPAAEAEEDAFVRQFDQTLNANLRAAYLAARQAGKVMDRGGSIINVTSINAHQGFPGNPAYVASKGGLRALTRALAVDLGPRGVRVNALAPGYIQTAMTAASYGDPVRNAARAQRTCLGRWGQPEDLVGAAIFLASDASAYMTGQDLVIDGGWLAKGLS